MNFEIVDEGDQKESVKLLGEVRELFTDTEKRYGIDVDELKIECDQCAKLLDSRMLTSLTCQAIYAYLLRIKRSLESCDEANGRETEPEKLTVDRKMVEERFCTAKAIYQEAKERFPARIGRFNDEGNFLESWPGPDESNELLLRAFYCYLLEIQDDIGRDIR
jgi:hypothetical protein